MQTAKFLKMCANLLNIILISSYNTLQYEYLLVGI